MKEITVEKEDSISGAVSIIVAVVFVIGLHLGVYLGISIRTEQVMQMLCSDQSYDFCQVQKK